MGVDRDAAHHCALYTDNAACIDHLPEEVWDNVAAKLTTERGGLECRLRWFSALHPSLEKVAWNDAMDEALLGLVQHHQERNVRVGVLRFWVWSMCCAMYLREADVLLACRHSPSFVVNT